PSASIRILVPTLEALPQAFMTNTSLTAMQAMVSTCFALMASACWTKPGRCLALQVGVKAPGTENSTTFLPLNSSAVVMSAGPLSDIVLNVPSGMRLPTWMVMMRSLLQAVTCEPACNDHNLPRCDQPGLLEAPTFSKARCASAVFFDFSSAMPSST